MAIDQRHGYRTISILLFLIGIALIVFGVIENSGWFIFGSICCIIGSLITFGIAQAGYKGYKERLTADSRKSNLKSTRRYPSRLDKYGTVEMDDLASWREKTKAELISGKITIQPFEIQSIGETCMICKLSIKERETVYQCSQCDCYFHQEHLESWLIGNSNCPVCESQLKSDRRF